MLIEILGPSGIGKSYFLKNKLFSQKSVSIKYFFSFKFINFFFFVLKLNFIQTFFYASSISFSQRLHLFYKKLKYFIFFNNNAKFKTYTDSEQTFIDEGIFGYFVNLMEDLSNFEKDFTNYLKYVTYKPDKFIILLPNNKYLVFKNMDIRGRWPRKNLGNNYFNLLITRQIEICEKIIDLNKKLKMFELEVIYK